MRNGAKPDKSDVLHCGARICFGRLLKRYDDYRNVGKGKDHPPASWIKLLNRVPSAIGYFFFCGNRLRFDTNICWLIVT